jgi:hypothetical protein
LYSPPLDYSIDNRSWQQSLAFILFTAVCVASLFSLGPFLTINDKVTDIPLPYYALFEVFPPFRALRVPARWAIIALIPLTLLCGLFIDLLIRRRYIIPAALLIMVSVVERCPLGLVPREHTLLSVSPADLGPAEFDLINFLKARPSPDILVYWPLLHVNARTSWDYDAGIANEARYGYLSLSSRKHTVNGYSGFEPPSYKEFTILVQRRNTNDLQSYLQSIGTSLVIIDKRYTDIHYTQQWPPSSLPIVYTNDRYVVQLLGLPTSKQQQQPLLHELSH